MWIQLQNHAVVQLHEIFVDADKNGKEFIYFVYDYHPGAETIEEKLMGSNLSNSTDCLNEEELWAYIIQIYSAIHVVHKKEKSCRSTLSPTKILVTGNQRIRINCLGIEDAIDPHANIQELQNRDFISFRNLIIQISCKSIDAIENLAQSMESISNFYSPDLKRLIIQLSASEIGDNPINTQEILRTMNQRTFNLVNTIHCINENLNLEYEKCIENKRLLKILLKLGFINEKPDFDQTTAWSETGDRFILKLFRDYIFHQVDENNRPVVDFGHVIETLNKFDVSSKERVKLTSRNEDSMLIVNYEDLNKILEESFNQLLSKEVTNYPPQNRQFGMYNQYNPHMYYRTQ
eukprot:TRINITY_DN1425_c0_g1_i1.p1 TRINITY_DN1425_c0_g1~~TRINITY_DN1425_c0_g1_i1.p1  ORF type:complete len:348 (+),score=65.24 TRINITY_DN1425_c0_g1_i1:866-1909(+)